jgi:valyl-tRNA synthetase
VKLEFCPGAAPKSAAVRSTPELDLVLDVPQVQDDPARKQKELDQLNKNIANIERQLADDKFLGKAPPHIVESLRTKLSDYRAQRDKLS